VIERRPFGRSGFSVPFLGLGRGKWNVRRGEALRAIRRPRLGASHIDTAEMYGAGPWKRSWGGDRRERGRPFWFPRFFRKTPGTRGAAGVRKKPEAVRTDRLDCYLLHWKEEKPLEETLRAFETLLKKEDPLVRGEQLQRGRGGWAHRISAERSPATSPLSPGGAGIEHSVIPACRELGWRWWPIPRSPKEIPAEEPKKRKVLRRSPAEGGSAPPSRPELSHSRPGSLCDPEERFGEPRYGKRPNSPDSIDGRESRRSTGFSEGARERRSDALGLMVRDLDRDRPRDVGREADLVRADNIAPSSRTIRSRSFHGAVIVGRCPAAETLSKPLTCRPRCPSCRSSCRRSRRRFPVLFAIPVGSPISSVHSDRNNCSCRPPECFRDVH